MLCYSADQKAGTDRNLNDSFRPEADDRIWVGRIIMDALVNGVDEPQSLARFQSVIQHLRDRSCDAEILDCTALPLVLNDSNSALPTLDSTRLPARAALRRAITGAPK